MFQASMRQAQHDEPRRRAPDASQGNQGNPYFVTQLQNITVTEGDTVTLRCAAAGKKTRVCLLKRFLILRIRRGWVSVTRIQQHYPYDKFKTYGIIFFNYKAILQQQLLDLPKMRGCNLYLIKYPIKY